MHGKQNLLISTFFVQISSLHNLNCYSGCGVINNTFAGYIEFVTLFKKPIPNRIYTDACMRDRTNKKKTEILIGWSLKKKNNHQNIIISCVALNCTQLLSYDAIWPRLNI